MRFGQQRVAARRSERGVGRGGQPVPARVGVAHRVGVLRRAVLVVVLLHASCGGGSGGLLLGDGGGRAPLVPSFPDDEEKDRERHSSNERDSPNDTTHDSAHIRLRGLLEPIRNADGVGDAASWPAYDEDAARDPHVNTLPQNLTHMTLTHRIR